jgi:hypothetical protein
MLLLASCASPTVVNSTKMVNKPVLTVPAPSPLQLTPFNFQVISDSTQLSSVMKSNGVSELYFLTPKDATNLLLDLEEYQTYVQLKNSQYETLYEYYSK